ncbi:hypothetical protein LJR039_002391 [Pseudorhodoferax sp. LjRoot39]|uniref:hypothetical protein n=1 Tax=Pseudorhodoferax sp. LjRoot39 TaxID=3342328 RepID=UPI003ECF72AC
MLTMLTMLGLCSGGVPSVAPRWPSVLAFIVPMTVGLITALAWRADTIHLFLAACAVLHVGATLHFAHAQHKLLTIALATRFEKEALAQQVRITQQASEEKTRFFAAASHDLRQPLHAVALFGVVLERELRGHASQPHAQRLMRAVNALSGARGRCRRPGRRAAPACARGQRTGPAAGHRRNRARTPAARARLGRARAVQARAAQAAAPGPGGTQYDFGRPSTFSAMKHRISCGLTGASRGIQASRM